MFGSAARVPALTQPPQRSRQSAKKKTNYVGENGRTPKARAEPPEQEEEEEEEFRFAAEFEVTFGFYTLDVSQFPTRFA